MSFDKCKQLYNQHHNQDIKYFLSFLKGLLCPLVSNVLQSLFPDNQQFAVTLVFPILLVWPKSSFGKDLSELFGQPNRSSTSPDRRGYGKRTCLFIMCLRLLGNRGGKHFKTLYFSIMKRFRPTEMYRE